MKKHLPKDTHKGESRKERRLVPGMPVHVGTITDHRQSPQGL
jgi:hypothetical protein